MIGDRQAWRISAILWLLCIVLFASCAPSKAQNRRIIRSPEAVAQMRVQRAVQRADMHLESMEWQRAPVRYNPSYCDSPAWEAHLYGAWRRVYLTPVPARSDEAMQQAWLKVSSERYESPQGWKYPVMQWRAMENPTP